MDIELETDNDYDRNSRNNYALDIVFWNMENVITVDDIDIQEQKRQRQQESQRQRRDSDKKDNYQKPYQ